MSQQTDLFKRSIDVKQTKELPTIPSDVVDGLLPLMVNDIGKGLGYRVAYVEGRGKTQLVIVVDASEPARYVDVSEKGKDVIGRAYHVDAGKGVPCLEDKDGNTMVLDLSAREPNRVYRARAESMGKRTTLADK